MVSAEDRYPENFDLEETVRCMASPSLPWAQADSQTVVGWSKNIPRGTVKSNVLRWIFLTFFHHVSHPKKTVFPPVAYRCPEPRQFAQQLAKSGLTAPREDWMSFSMSQLVKRDSICRTKPLCTLYAYFNSQENIWWLIWIQKKNRGWQHQIARVAVTSTFPGRSRRRWSSSHYAWFTGMCCGWQILHGGTLMILICIDPFHSKWVPKWGWVKIRYPKIMDG